MPVPPLILLPPIMVHALHSDPALASACRVGRAAAVHTARTAMTHLS